MSYAYLFKYIIIGDTGILLLLLSSRVYVCVCVRGFGVCVCVIFFIGTRVFFIVVLSQLLFVFQSGHG
jgi:hypothetical protein